MSDLPTLLHRAADAADVHATLPDRPVPREVDPATLRSGFGGSLPPTSTPPEQVLRELIQAAEPGLVASAGPRFFGFVVGGSVPAAAAADMLAVGWERVAFNALTSPAAAAAEAVAGG